jgi:hypothetical protein
MIFYVRRPAVDVVCEGWTGLQVRMMFEKEEREKE